MSETTEPKMPGLSRVVQEKLSSYVTEEKFAVEGLWDVYYDREKDSGEIEGPFYLYSNLFGTRDMVQRFLDLSHPHPKVERKFWHVVPGRAKVTVTNLEGLFKEFNVTV